MPLFQKTIINKYLKTQNTKELQQKWEVFHQHFHNPVIQENIRNSKEEQYQGEFLIDLFVNVLGYTKNPTPDFNLTTEYKNIKDSKKADGAIVINSKVAGIIELKGTNTTDLAKIEDQAFGYKNNQKDCKYVITSNFEKLRFYIDNAIEHLEFNLFELSQEDFEVLYLCLAFPNISADIPGKIKDESLSQEDVITKKLYKDYSLFKRELFQNLLLLNPEYDQLELFKKSQKLLDRFLFLFFGEDSGLLPPNSVRMILEQWDKLRDLDEYVPLYDRFRKYFTYLNTGFKGKQFDVFAYNGGLFKPDEILDTVKIDDQLLYTHTLKLAEYDFESEVDVNILGHIFENSLNEIDEIKAQLAGEVIDKSKTKRKKDGVFYTPKYITKYIVENTVGKLCTEKKAEIKIVDEEYFADKKRQTKTKEALLLKLKTYRDWLLQITIIDPACGSGAFLNEALNFLMAEHKYLDELETKLLGGGFVFPNIENSILENNLFGVDLNEESVEIAKLSLWLRTAQPYRKLNDLNHNIKCGNSLIDDPAIAGDKAFNWEQEFPKVFKEKDKRAFHITTALHDSRTSQRMIDYKVREKRHNGTAPTPHVIPLTADEELLITETIAEIKEKDNLKILSYNICRDHLHLLIVCEYDELPFIVQKIKSVTSRKVNIARGFTIPAPATEQAPLLSPLPKKRGEKQNSLWTQKFGQKIIESNEQLMNTIAYIDKNRSKHELPEHSTELKLIIEKQIICSLEDAFAKEYKGGFDVVIGNPPYVPTEYIQEYDKQYLEKNYQSASGRINLYPIFYEKAINILKRNGVLGFITPYTILKNQYFKEARKFILENSKILEIVDFKGTMVFNDAAVDSIIFILEKITQQHYDFKQISNIVSFENQLYSTDKFNISEIYSNDDLSMQISINDKIFKRIINHSIPLKKVVNFNQGIITGGNSKFIISEKTENSEKVLTGSDFNRYSLNDSKNFIIYDTEKLHRPRKKIIFEATEKILLRQTAAFPILTFDYQQYYTLDTVHNGLLIDENYNLKFILSVLNSQLLKFLYESQINEGGKVFAQVKIIYIDELPIKQIPLESQQPFIDKADQMLSLNKELQEVNGKFQRMIQRKFFPTSIPTPPTEHAPLHSNTNKMLLTKKLQNWHQLSYGDFIKELSKQKVKLSLAEESDWEDYFVTEQQKAIALQSEITKTDAEIDQMVYELYGLTEEEIGIVENA